MSDHGIGSIWDRENLRNPPDQVEVLCYSPGMTSGLERVAHALCELDANPPDATMGGKPLWQDYLPEAWAAIMALREPDAAMFSAAALEAGHVGKDDVGRIYRAMIDAALVEWPPAAGKTKR